MAAQPPPPLKLQLTTEARSDIGSLSDWYAAAGAAVEAHFQRKLGIKFMRLCQNPLVYPVVHGKVRRAVLEKFPYVIYFVASASAIQVVAGLHQHRSPHFISQRLVGLSV